MQRRSTTYLKRVARGPTGKADVLCQLEKRRVLKVEHRHGSRRRGQELVHGSIRLRALGARTAWQRAHKVEHGCQIVVALCHVIRKDRLVEASQAIHEPRRATLLGYGVRVGNA